METTPSGAALTGREVARERALQRRVEGYAAKFIAETDSAEPPTPAEPTDERLAAILGRCVRPAPARLYPEIRDKILDRSWIVRAGSLTAATYADGEDFLHNGDGEHRGTAPTANGADLDRFDREIREHLAAHQRQGRRQQHPGELTARTHWALADAAVAGSTVTVSTKVDADDWQQVKTVLSRIAGGGRYVRGGLFRFPDGRNPRPELAAVLEQGTMPPNPQLREGWFPTPAELAQEIVHNDPHILALWEEGPPGRSARVLEPSAGEGALADALAELGFAPVCVERDPWRAAVLRSKGYDTVVGSFELFWKDAHEQGRWFDLVVMNPPFRSHGTHNAYLGHLELAWTLLAPGGRLVAILPQSITTRQDVPHRRIADLIGRFGQVRPLPEHAFRESGTGVRTVLVTMDRPVNANPGTVEPVPTEASQVALFA